MRTRWFSILRLCLVCVLLTISVSACASDTSVSEVLTATDQDNDAQSSDAHDEDSADVTIERPEGWGEETHSNDVDPNYDVVFAQDHVHEMTITIDPEDWQAMQDNMVALFGESGSGDNNRRAGGDFAQPQEGNFPARPDGDAEGDFQPREDAERPVEPEVDAPDTASQPENRDWQAQRPGGDDFGGRPEEGGFGAGGGDMTPENPMWVEATITYDGNTWTNVGVRYKGNSSLTSGWRSGTMKLPLKLDFDEFEEDYPEIEDQRFYGFKQLSLANGFSDASFLRDAVTAQILEDAGLPAAKTAFYQISVDYGEGPVVLGLYTVIEVIDDTAVERYFGNDDGNIYEAEGSAASLAASTYDQIEDSFQKENNEEEADWSDIEALYEVLHSDVRGSDPDTWRTDLESLFDVDAFLEWLAISAVLEHWDAYGSMSHNYYLYNNPDTGQLTWISWDHNQTMSGGGMGGGRNPGGRGVSLDKDDVGENWPLIRYLLDDPVYYDKYIDYIAETIAGPFNADDMAETFTTLAEMIRPYAIADVGEQEFDAAVAQLTQYAYTRVEAVQAFLAGE